MSEKMTVKKSMETKTYLIYKTATHEFKINEEQLEKLEGAYADLQSKIQKSMKQLVDVSKASWWAESWKAIFKEITGQDMLEDFDATEQDKKEVVEE